MQHKKNTFRFATFAAAFGLGVGFLVSGCGDSGSTTPNPLNGGTYKVTFQYSSLAKSLSRTEVKEDITKVRYAFCGKSENNNFVTEATKEREFKHETTTQEQDITIDSREVDKLDSGIYGVAAAYYDKDDNLVAIGYDTIDWQGKNEVTIANPSLYTIAQSDFSLTSYDPLTGKNKAVFKPGEDVGLSFKLLPGGEASGKSYDLTPFATFSKLNDIDDNTVAVLEAAKDGPKGRFTAAANGTVQPCATIGSTVAYTMTEPIYVTEQTISGIELSPANKDITVVDGNSFYMIYVDKKDSEGKDIPNATLGQKTLVAEPEIENFDTLTMGVDEVPMQVIATYTTDKKGPQPKNINIIDEAKLTTALIGSVENPLLEVKDGSLLATGTTDKNTCDNYQVTAKYGQFTDTNEVTVSYATSELCFAWRYEGSGSERKYVPDFFAIGDTPLVNKSLEVVGRFYINDWTYAAVYNSRPFEIDNLIGTTGYPEALVENEPFDEAAMEAGAKFVRVEGGYNKYLLNFKGDGECHELKVKDFTVDLPGFKPFILKP